MGLFLTADGHFQGWLAALLCCCAVSQDESPYEKKRERSTRTDPIATMPSYDHTDTASAPAQPQICNTQPSPLVELPATPVSTARLQTTTKDDTIPDTEETRHAAARPPSLKPLDLGDSSLLGRHAQHGRKRSSFGHSKRPSISAPYSFRRLDTPEPQRQSLVPLRLGPVVLRESSAPQTESPTTKAMMNRERSDSTSDLLPQTDVISYHSHRETPYERCQARRSVVTSAQAQEAPAKSLRRSTSAEDHRSIRRSASTKRSSSSLRRDASHSATLFPTRQSAERPSLRRKASFPIRKPFAEAGDIDTDKEVLELNTIVEERRAEAARDKRGSQHIAAIAPHMQMRARSETLDAIGSALGRPLTAQANYRVPTPVQVQLRPSMRRTTSAGSRVSGWLSGMLTSHSVAHLPSDEPFYKCQTPAPALRRSHSEASIGTCLTEMDSPSLTAASSPTSKGHSRTHTGESRMTPLSPGTIYAGPNDVTEKTIELPWPTSPTSVVGLAL